MLRVYGRMRADASPRGRLRRSALVQRGAESVTGRCTRVTKVCLPFTSTLLLCRLFIRPGRRHGWPARPLHNYSFRAPNTPPTPAPQRRAFPSPNFFHLSYTCHGACSKRLASVSSLARRSVWVSEVVGGAGGEAPAAMPGGRGARPPPRGLARLRPRRPALAAIPRPPYRTGHAHSGCDRRPTRAVGGRRARGGWPPAAAAAVTARPQPARKSRYCRHPRPPSTAPAAASPHAPQTLAAPPLRPPPLKGRHRPPPHRRLDAATVAAPPRSNKAPTAATRPRRAAPKAVSAAAPVVPTLTASSIAAAALASSSSTPWLPPSQGHHSRRRHRRRRRYRRRRGHRRGHRRRRRPRHPANPTPRRRHGPNTTAPRKATVVFDLLPPH